MHWRLRRWKRSLCRASVYGVRVCVLSCFSRVCPFVTLWGVAPQAPLSMGFSRQEEWSGFAMPSSRGSSWPRDQTRVSYIHLHWQVGFLPLAPPGKPLSVERWGLKTPRSSLHCAIPSQQLVKNRSCDVTTAQMKKQTLSGVKLLAPGQIVGDGWSGLKPRQRDSKSPHPSPSPQCLGRSPDLDASSLAPWRLTPDMWCSRSLWCLLSELLAQFFSCRLSFGGSRGRGMEHGETCLPH